MTRLKHSTFLTATYLIAILLQVTYTTIASAKKGDLMVRLCIASVDPIKLSSQCVMCNRVSFPITTMDCTGITKMNDLIANPLSVQEATCLIYNCRRQVPGIKPEPYHGSVSHAVRTNYNSGASTRSYGMMPPHGMFGGSIYGSGLVQVANPLVGPYSQTLAALPQYSAGSPYSLRGSGSMISQSAARLGLTGNGLLAGGTSSASVPTASGVVSPNDLLGGRPQALPYAVIPATFTSPFGFRKYKSALVPLF